jgi:recombination protein RecT
MAGQLQKASEAKAAERDVATTQGLTLREAIKAAGPGFQMALPKHVSLDRFTRTAMTALQTVKNLDQCTQMSVLAGLMQAAQLGLEVADVRGQAYLIPRKNGRTGNYEATFQLGYRGMIDLAARSGITVDAEEIHENDVYDFALGTERFLRHKPSLTERGPVIAYYAVATFADGRKPSFSVMGVAEVAEHRDKFASSRDYKTKEIQGPWVDHFDAMARKTVIRALLNYLPVSVEMRQAVHQDAIEATGNDIGDVMHVPFTPDLPPEGIDAVTGEIDPMTPIAATSIEHADPTLIAYNDADAPLTGQLV